MRAAVVSVGVGGWYSRGIDRLSESLSRFAPGIDRLFWRDGLPTGCPPHSQCMYGFKTFALREARGKGYNLLIWADASMFAVSSIDPLIQHVRQHGYMVTDNGFALGQWASDKALAAFCVSRDEAMSVPECASGLVGLDLTNPEANSLLDEWHDLRHTFTGYHTNAIGGAGAPGLAYGGVGHVSDDPRCLGHRHDQTALSWLVHKRKWARTPRPIFWGYRQKTDPVDPRSVFLCEGM